MSKKVSLIVPVYNGAQVLSRCVDSILKQDEENFELLLVDDGSRDDSLKIAQAYAERDPRVRALHKENGGVSSARNFGLSMAEGEYIQFVDVDDWLPMESTKLLVREMENHGADMVVGDFYRVIGGKGSQKGSIGEGGVLTCRQYADAMLLSPADLYYGVIWNKLYRRDLIERYRIRMDERVSYSEDMIFNLEYLLHVDSIAVLKVPIYYYIHTKGSLMDQHNSLSSAVKMKRSVIGYYNRFYRHVYDEKSYQEKLPVIYGYLLSFSTDVLTVPFAPGTYNLGHEEGADLRTGGETDASLIAHHELNICLARRYLNTLAIKHNMEGTSMQVLFLLWKAGRPCSIEDMSTLTGIPQRTLMLSLSRLQVMNLVLRISGEGEKKSDVFGFTAWDMIEEFEQVERDFEKICFEGLEKAEIEAYLETVRKIDDHIRRHMMN